MKSIKDSNTSPEIIVRNIIHNRRCKFKVNDNNLPGKPDISLPNQKKVVFIHGCFWHGHKNCRRSIRPKTNIAFWNKKLDANIKRDICIRNKLRRMGWKVYTIWQCQIENKDALHKRINNIFK